MVVIGPHLAGSLCFEILLYFYSARSRINNSGENKTVAFSLPKRIDLIMGEGGLSPRLVIVKKKTGQENMHIQKKKTQNFFWRIFLKR